MLHRRDKNQQSRGKSQQRRGSGFGDRGPGRRSSLTYPSSLIPHPSRTAFTLIEMLVTISILLILAVITLATVNMTQTYDRIRAGARQVQSYYEGAKSRAAYAKDARGIRFLLDTADNTTASSMVFIGPPEKFSQGNVVIYDEMTAPTSNFDGVLDYAEDLNMNGTNDPIYIDYPPIWTSLANRNRLSDGARIELPRGLERYYTIAQSANGSGRWYLTSNYGGGTIPSGLTEYSLELNPAVLPNQEPRPLGTGIVIDLDNSRIPGTWRTGGVGSAYTQQLDVLFTPRGTVTGASAGDGTIHLVLASTADTIDIIPPPATGQRSIPTDAVIYDSGVTYSDGDWVKLLPTGDTGCFYLCRSGGTSAGITTWPTRTGQTVSDGSIIWECYQVNEKMIVSLFTHTGRVSTHAVHKAAAVGEQVDIFREAELGREIR